MTHERVDRGPTHRDGTPAVAALSVSQPLVDAPQVEQRGRERLAGKFLLPRIAMGLRLARLDRALDKPLQLFADRLAVILGLIEAELGLRGRP